MELNRKPKLQEERLLELLVKKSSILIQEGWKNGLLVCPMDDGEMGSLRLFPKGKVTEVGVFGKQVSDFQFTDLDGVEVFATLNIDNEGNLFELDIWKTDFGKLLKLPDL